MIEKVEKWCEERNLLQKGDCIVVACSGGPDSLVLADILMKLRQRYMLTLIVAHMEHGIRGAASKEDAAFVRTFCRGRNLSYVERCEDVPAYAKQHALSLEDAARQLRYRFLRRVAERQRRQVKIATGHHQDDQAETVLLHLLRGAGSGGIAGISPSSCGIIRPLLSVSRTEIEAYCEAAQLMPRIDETNFVPDYLRNKIRLTLLPMLTQEYNPALKEALCRTAELVGAEHAFIREYAEKSFAVCATEEKRKIIFRREALAKLPTAIKREVFRCGIERLRGHLKEIRFFHIERMIVFAEEGKTGTVLELPGGMTFRCMYGAVELFAAQKVSLGESFDIKERSLKIPGVTLLVEIGMKIEAEFVDGEKRLSGKNQIVCDVEKLSFPVIVRTRKDGDRFSPSGMQGSKKLKDFFIDEKIRREERDKIVLFCDQTEIFWVGGIRQNQSSRCSSATAKYLLLTIVEQGRK